MYDQWQIRGGTLCCFELHKLIFQNANVGAGPITVTMNREKAVDFTNPIYSFEAVSVRLRPPGPPDDLQVGTLQTVAVHKDFVGYSILALTIFHHPTGRMQMILAPSNEV